MMAGRIGAAVLSLVAWGLSGAQDRAEQPVSVHIESQSVRAALQQFGEQTGLQILMRLSGNEADDARVPSVQGKFTVKEALERLLFKSGLQYEFINDRTVRVSSPMADSASQISTVPLLRFAQAETSSRDGGGRQGEVAGQETGDHKVEDPAQSRRRVELEEIVVTGTHIRGVKDQISPVTSIGRDEMDLAGYTNVADVFKRLPQNYGGGASLLGTSAGSVAGIGGVGINLRGLGSEATLVLLNGRRLAPGGLNGNFVDIASIPTSAIERIEVMTDGASAIYGSDAIAGVVNIILRKDFDGAESRVNLNTITDSGSVGIKAGQTFGWSGDRAHGLLTYEYSSEEELNAKDKSFARNAVDPYYLLPDSRKNNVFASTGVQLSDRVRVSADGYFNDRRTQGYSSTSSLGLTQTFQDLESRQTGGAVGLNVRIAGDWQADLSAAYSRSHQHSDIIRQRTRSGYVDDTQTDITSFDASVGGSLFQWGAEAVRGVFGVHYRSEGADIWESNRLTGAALIDVKDSRHVSAVYAELHAPLVTEESAIPAVQRLAVTLAARYDDYSDVGHSVDPRVGAVWTPLRGLNVRASYGTSFRAARLDQLVKNYDVFLGAFADPTSPTGRSFSLALSGSGADLDPEKATTWTAGIDFEPAAFAGLTVRGTYFNVDYKDRISTASYLFDPNGQVVNFIGDPIRDPSLETLQSLVDGAKLFYYLPDFFPVLGPVRLEDVTVLVDGRLQNMAASRVAGIDLEVTHEVSSAIGSWSFSLEGTYLTTFDQQASSSSPVLVLVDTYRYPADLKIRTGVVWQTAPVTAALYINYVDGYKDTGATAGPYEIAAWTTADVSLRFDLGKRFSGTLAQGASLAFTVTNLLNRDPPAIGVARFRDAFYDAANADPTGRRVGLLLTKRW